VTTEPLVLALDVGTSGVKAVLCDGQGTVRSSTYRPYPLLTVPGGGVEQDCAVIFDAVGNAAAELVSGQAGLVVAAIAVTAQMFNVVAVDDSGAPAGMMLSWLDQRADVTARKLESTEPNQFEVFGARLTAKDVVPRIIWMREERPEEYARARWLLDCKEAVVLWLTGEAVTDPSGASAFRIATDDGLAWDAARCAAAGVEMSLLPPIRRATEVAGGLRPDVASAMGLPPGVDVFVGTGDVPASQLGSGAVLPGDAHLSLGTAAYFGLLMAEPRTDPAKNLAPLVHADCRSAVLWLEIATGGAALTWAMRLTGLSADGPPDFERMEELVEAADDEMGALLFAPWLTGERVPIFDDSLRGVVVGLDLHHGPGHLLRSVMLGVAYQLRWALEYGEAFGQAAQRIVAVGGGALGAVWSQMIADVLGRELICLDEAQDAAAVGAAACALVGLAVQPSFMFLRSRGASSVTYQPRADLYERHSREFARFQALASPPGAEADHA
jgi:sugar (pentulose or hexulose) kinase